jgi:hypothetical protein
MLITLAIGLGAIVLIVAIWRHWLKLHSPDMGNMSRQWVVEQSAQPPND